jgi:UDP-3-O-[3-hydroxymyristoyl] glucosamine N-acyltransferase
MSWTLGQLAVRFGCSLRGDPDLRVERVATLAQATPGTITFLANPRYRAQLATTRATAVILAAEHAEQCPAAALIAADPYATYARVAALLHPAQAHPPGVHPRAVVAADATIAPGASIGACVVIESGARVGEHARVGPGCVVGARAEIGSSSELVASVVVCHDVRIGSRVLVHPGTVIGADGFGFAREPEGWLKVPQLGSVVIGDDVEIGALTTIDRGAIEDTVVEEGVKLDNNIQVAHNVRIGAHTIIAACVGISGSTVIGKRCMIAGAVGFVGHLQIADDVVITGQTMVNRSIDKPGVYSSALPMDEAVRWRRNSARFRHLDELARRVQALEATLGKKGERDRDD